MQIAALQEQYHNELKLELQGANYSSVSNDAIQNATLNSEAVEASVPDLQQIAEDAANMSKVLMPRKKRKLYEAMQVLLCWLFSFICFSGSVNY